MAKLMRIAPFCAALALIGCGGGGSGGGFNSDENQMVDALQRSIDAFNDEDLFELEFQMSENFLDDCSDEEEFLAESEAIFDDPDTNIEVRIIDIIDVDEVNNDDEGIVRYEFEVRETINGNTDVFRDTITDVFFFESGRWQWAGDQECSVALRTARGLRWRKRGE